MTVLGPRLFEKKKAYPKICLFLFYFEFILSEKTYPANRGGQENACTGAGKTRDTQCLYRSREGQSRRRLAGRGTGGAGARKCVAFGGASLRRFPAFL